MKANELMIGDWLNTSRGIAKVIAVDKIGLTFKIDGGDFDIDWDDEEEWFDVIPLTPEILKKNGFTYYESDGSFVLFTNISYGNWNVDVVLFNVTHEYRNNQLHISTLDDSTTLLHLMECNYVHELQHALRLCGIEKEIII